MWFMGTKSGAKSIAINSKNTKTSRESNKSNKISSQQCSCNKNNERVKNPKIIRLHYTSKHSLCEGKWGNDKFW